jgi:hypothetical protein
VTAYAPAAVNLVPLGHPGEGLSLPANTIGYLAGEWNVVREIADHQSGQSGEFRGRASFRPAAANSRGSVLDFVEEGELRFGAHRGPASRSLRYRGRADGTADVYFADGRAFYRLDLRTGSCRALHPCRSDRYVVTVTWLDADSFTEIWRVTGPAKDYDMTTVYTRAGRDT